MLAKQEDAAGIASGTVAFQVFDRLNFKASYVFLVFFSVFF